MFPTHITQNLLQDARGDLGKGAKELAALRLCCPALGVGDLLKGFAGTAPTSEGLQQSQQVVSTKLPVS